MFTVVVGGGGRDQCPFKRGDGLTDPVDRELAEDRLELPLVDRHLAEPFHHTLVGEAHLDRILDRTHGLRLERLGAAIPELRTRQDAVERHR